MSQGNYSIRWDWPTTTVSHLWKGDDRVGYMGISALVIGTLGLLECTFRLAGLSTAFHFFGTTPGWVVLPLSLLLFLNVRLTYSTEESRLREALKDELDSLTAAIQDKDAETLYKLHKNRSFHLTVYPEIPPLGHEILKVAAQKNHQPLIESLLVTGDTYLYALIMRNPEPLKIALEQNNHEVIPIFLKAISQKNWHLCHSVLFEAFKKAFSAGEDELVLAILSRLDDEMRKEYFHFACQSCNRLSISLIYKVLSLCFPNFLHRPHAEFSTNREIFRGELDVKRFLIYSMEKGYVNSPNESGDTPLHSAIKERDRKRAEMLIEHGADLDLKNADGFSPLELLVSQGDLNLVKDLAYKISHPLKAPKTAIVMQNASALWALLHARALTNLQLRILLSFAIQLTDLPIISILTHTLSYKLDRDMYDRITHQDNRAESFIECAKKVGIEKEVRALCFERDEALYFENFSSACIHGNMETLRTLIRAKYDLNAPIGVTGTSWEFSLQSKKPGRVGSPLMIACTFDLPRSKEILTLLLENGARPEAEVGSMTALHAAIKNRNDCAVSALLDHDASLVNLVDSRRYTPLMYLQSAADTAILDKCLEKGVNLNYRTQDGTTLLHLVAGRADLKTAEKTALFATLIMHGANPHTLDFRRLFSWQYLSPEMVDSIKANSQGQQKRITDQMDAMRVCHDCLMLDLPQEITVQIFSYLSPKERRWPKMVSKPWWTVIKQMAVTKNP